MLLLMIPKSGILGEKISLSTDTVALHKYIMRRGKRIGYYSGYTLANRMGLSTQVPFTEENVKVLQFLDCLKDVDRCAEEELDVCGNILTRYAREHDITRAMIDKFITNYPVKIYKAIYETGVKYVLYVSA